MSDICWTKGHITLISGIPASGKTTLAKALANHNDRGIHLEGDAFHRFLAHPVDPYSPDSRAQAEAIAKAVACSARSFAEQGYEVFVDGVIGPWNLANYDDEIGSFDYAILDVDSKTAIDRMSRRGDAKLEYEGVKLLWRFFHNYPNVLSRHALSAVASPETVLEEFERRRAIGELHRNGSASHEVMR